MTTRRQKVRVKRTERFWAVKRAAQATPEGVAAVAFDHLRATVADLPTEARGPAWERVTRGLDNLTATVTDGKGRL